MQLLTYLGSTGVKRVTWGNMSSCIFLHAWPKLTISHFYLVLVLVIFDPLKPNASIKSKMINIELFIQDYKTPHFTQCYPFYSSRPYLLAYCLTLLLT